MSTLESLLSLPVFEALGWTLIHFAWQGVVVAILFAILSSLLEGARSTVRYGLSCAALLTMLILAISTLCLLYPSAPVQWDLAAVEIEAATPPPALSASGSVPERSTSVGVSWLAWRDLTYGILVGFRS